MEVTMYQRYGIAMLQMLRRAGGPVRKAALAEECDISEEYVQQVMRGLLAAGLVTSNRSNTEGGYMLAVPKHRATVGEVVKALPVKSRSGENARMAELGRLVKERVAVCLGRIKVDDLGK